MKLFSFLKYSLVNKIEKIPLLQIFIYNNLQFLKFLLPHDKDYHALKLLFKKNEKRSFIDVGGNIGLSSVGWRVLGFDSNKILIFEPDNYLNKKYLYRIKHIFKNIYIYNFGLSKKNIKKNLYKAYYKKKYFHFNNSFSLKYIKQKLKDNYPYIHNEFKIKKKKLILKKFDNLKIKTNICFIKIDVEGYDHFVIDGMKKTIKKNQPVILVEYNKVNFKNVYHKLSKNYFCYTYLYERNALKKFNLLEIDRLKNGIYNPKNFLKNSINVFFIPKKNIKINK